MMNCSPQQTDSTDPAKVVARAAVHVRKHVEAWGLGERPLPPSFATAHGSFGENAVRLDSWVWEGEHPTLQRVALALGSSPNGAFSSLTALVIPRPDQDLPLLAADIVAFRGRFVVAVVDLCCPGDKVLPDRVEHPRSALLDRAEPRVLPTSFRDALSPTAVCVREAEQPIGEELGTLWEAYLRHFESLRLVSVPPVSASARAQLHEDFMETLRLNKRESRALASLFGQPWAQAYLTEHFFSLG